MDADISSLYVGRDFFKCMLVSTKEQERRQVFFSMPSKGDILRRGRQQDSGGSLQHVLVEWYRVERGLIHIKPLYFPQPIF